MSIVEALAAVTDSPADDLQPLGEIINPERLDQLFPPATEQPAVPSALSFVYEGHPITVTHEGEIQVYAPDAIQVCRPRPP